MVGKSPFFEKVTKYQFSSSFQLFGILELEASHKLILSGHLAALSFWRCLKKVSFIPRNVFVVALDTHNLYQVRINRYQVATVRENPFFRCKKYNPYIPPTHSLYSSNTAKMWLVKQFLKKIQKFERYRSKVLATSKGVSGLPLFQFSSKSTRQIISGRF